MTSPDTSQVYRSWLNALNRRDEDGIALPLSQKVIHNGQDYDKKAYTRRIADTLSDSSVDNIELDQLIVGNDAASLAARLIHQGTLVRPYLGAQVTGQRIEWSEHAFVWFQGGKITRVQSLLDLDTLRKGTSQVPRSPTLYPAPAPEGFDMVAMYRDYIHAINTLTMAEHFPKYCLPNVAHNTRGLTVDEYRLLIESSFDEIQGLTFTVKEIITDHVSQQLGARLEFTGTPVKEFMGIKPTGKQIKFWEHVFYKLDGGKITWVWAMLDLEAFRKCLQGGY